MLISALIDSEGLQCFQLSTSLLLKQQFCSLRSDCLSCVGSLFYGFLLEQHVCCLFCCSVSVKYLCWCSCTLTSSIFYSVHGLSSDFFSHRLSLQQCKAQDHSVKQQWKIEHFSALSINRMHLCSCTCNCLHHMQHKSGKQIGIARFAAGWNKLHKQTS